jgi:hypothetical protein
VAPDLARGGDAIHGGGDLVRAIGHDQPFSLVGQPGFSEYARECVGRTGRVVEGRLAAGLASSAAVVRVVGGLLAGIGLTLVGVIGMSTCV